MILPLAYVTLTLRAEALMLKMGFHAIYLLFHNYILFCCQNPAYFLAVWMYDS